MGIHPQSSQKSGTGAGWTSEEDQTQGEQKSQEKEDPDTNKSKTDREGAPRHGMHSEEKRKEEEQIEKGNKKVTENHIISESKIPGQPPKAENTIAEKTVHKAEGTLPKMNLADFIDPLPNTLFHLLPEKEWNCEACGKLRNILVGPFGPYLKCTGRKCGKNKGIDLKMIREAFRLLQIPCPACGSPMIVDRGIRGGPFPGCSQYPNCMANESWNDLNQRLKTVEVRQRLGNMKAT
jgi:ssDNA-binding Zn-finger/Zn-ribbon topoisomerase 1